MTASRIPRRASDLPFTPTGTIAATNTQAAIEEAASESEAYNVLDYLAVGDGVTNDGTSINNTFTAAGRAFTSFPHRTYLVSALTTLLYSKINGLGSVLKPSANTMTVLTLMSGPELQAADVQTVCDIVIDASGKTGITGIDIDQTNPTASLNLTNIITVNCDVVGFNLRSSQFIKSLNLKSTSGGGVGMQIVNDPGGGGANSHDHYGLQLIDKEVGLFISGLHYNTPAWSHNFYNLQLIGNSVCGAAFFDANVTLYGGAPEFNGTGAATKVVDGQTVKRCSAYLADGSLIRFVGLNIGEATVNPCFIVEGASTLVLTDASGYGVATGVLVKADSTSMVNLEGTFACAGIVQNVGAWPDSWLFDVTGSQSILYGQPIHKVDPTLPVLYSHQAPALAGGGAHAPAMSYVEDADLGYCRQAVFTAFAGSVNDNFAAADTIGSGVASRGTVISVLVKSSIDTQIGINFHDGAAYNSINTDQIFLKAGKVTRLIYGARNLAAGSWQLFWYPIGTDAPTIVFANLQVYQGADGVQTTAQEIAKIIKQGSFNPGPLRDTTTNLALQSAAVNTKGKYPGKQVWNTTTNRVVFAAGPAVSDVWKDGVNATVHTPV